MYGSNNISPYKPDRRNMSNNRLSTDMSRTSTSPLKKALHESQIWQSKCKDLERNLQQASSDLNLATYKAAHSQDLEKKIEMVLQHNGQLLAETNNLQKQINQRKAETEIWKGKYEVQMGDSLKLKADYEMEIKKLTQTAKEYQDSFNRLQIETQKDLENERSQNEIRMHELQQELKGQHCEDIGLFEEQLRKTREILEEREKELSYEKTKYEKNIQDAKLELVRAQEEKERQNHNLSVIELQQQEKLQELQQRLERQSSQTVNNLKQMNQNQVEVLENEIKRIRELLELKNEEIQNLINQNHDQQSNFSEEEEALRSEISNLKQSLEDNNKKIQEELETKTKNLIISHDNELQGLRFHHENAFQSLNLEIENLKEINRGKSDEIQVQITEKLKQRQDYSNEMDRLNQIIDDLTVRQCQQDEDIKKIMEENNFQMQKEAEHHQNQMQKKQSHIESLEIEIKELKKLNELKDQNQQDQTSQFEQIEEGLKGQITNLQQQLVNGEDNFNRMVNDKNEQLLEKTAAYEKMENNLKERLEQQNEQLEQAKFETQKVREELQKQIEDYNDLSIFKEKQEHLLKEHQQELKKLHQDIEFQAKQHDNELRELEQKLVSHHKLQLDSIHSDNYSKAEDLLSENNALKSEIQVLKNQYNILQTKNDELQAAVDELEVHSEKLQEYERKIANLSQDIVCTKQLYGNIVKTKARYGSPEKQQPLY